MAATKAQQTVAEELKVCATWVTGAKRTKLLSLAAQLEGGSAPEPSETEKREAARAEAKADSTS